MIGRILATSNENVAVRFMNPSNEENIVYKATAVRQFVQVKGNVDKVILEVKKNSSSPEQLEDWSTKLQMIFRKGNFKVFEILWRNN